MKMQMKTSELSGATLDWAVAKCEGYKFVHAFPAWKNKHGAHGPAQVMVSYKKNVAFAFSPSTNWSQSGPIIEQESIAIDYNIGEQHCIASLNWNEGYSKGKTPLEAAMRCYVAGKLGNEVEVPVCLTS